MKFLAICLHCLDMRDFHSALRDTPFLDGLRQRSIFIPMGRAHGHNNKDSANAEMTGQWTARYCDSHLTAEGYTPYDRTWFPRTLPEYLAAAGYDIFTLQGDGLGNAAISFMDRFWMKSEPERTAQFNTCRGQTLEQLLQALHGSEKFYAHLYLRETHRPWAQMEGLCAMVGRPPAKGWPDCAYAARRAALEHPDEFAALRRRGLALADSRLQMIFEATADIKDLTYIVFSNHGEVFDHFRYVLPHINTGDNMIVGVSHGPYPYEVLYATMQMWLIPGRVPAVMNGMGRLIDYAPTVLDLAGADHGFMDGSSMTAAFDKGELPARERYAESGTAASGSCISMVRPDGYKLVAMNPEPLPEAQAHLQPHTLHRLAVFDLNTDPCEYVNIISTPRGQEILRWAAATHADLKKPV